ncbi:MAG: SDR family NAD(P)-dependent oxidoreductase [Verrucomicrobia bacterium]|jgi:NAD(P)-dependent dehydrogenase (short-subunit alcohol dehydrogenase family)|nr:SDR family NAD(P)-dependent oxidoreductase [Verrucomicrobiota bacterium]
MDLNGKTILVVGGTSGLGESAARMFLKCGARVVVTGRNEDKLQAATSWLGDDGMALSCDASSSKETHEVFRKLKEAFGDLHGVYHVAGGSGRRFGDGPLHEITDEGWDLTMKLNLDSVFYSNRAAIRIFLEQGKGGAIVNCGSVLGFSPSPRFFTTHAYAAAKSAMIGMTKSAAAHYAGNGIRINLLCPGLVATPMSERAQTNQPIMDFIRTKQPLDGGRIGMPEDLDGAAAFLLSDAACFVTGQVLSVDGGWSVSEGKT